MFNKLDRVLTAARNLEHAVEEAFAAQKRHELAQLALKQAQVEHREAVAAASQRQTVGVGE